LNQFKIKQEIISRFKEQKTLEDEMANQLMAFYNSTTNPLVKLFVHWIVLDTRKHSEIYQTLITLNSGSGVIIGDMEKDRMTKELTTHVSKEAEMLKRSEEIGDQIEDENTKALYEIIINDEKRHHQLLVDLLWLIEKIDEIGRDEWHKKLNSMMRSEKRIPRTSQRMSVQRSRTAR
jgi:hypothetical protein